MENTGRENSHKKMQNNIFHLQTLHNEFFSKHLVLRSELFSLGDAYKNVFFQDYDFLNNIKAKHDKVRMTHGNNIPKHIKLKKI